MEKSFRAAAIAAVIATLSQGVFAAERNAIPVSFMVEPQPLQTALNEWAQQAGLQVVWQPDATSRQLVTPGVTGTLDAEAALRMLLQGSGLTYSFIDPSTVAVSPQAASGAPAASEVDEAVRANSGPEELVVTGSRLRRGYQDDVAPIAVFDRKKIDELGVSNVAEVLDYLPQQPFPNREEVRAGGTRVAQLRGLPMGSTLVLINGRRTVTSALSAASNFFDLNTIPLAAVERIEVLADSASAVYGADAIGGVVNIILKKRIDDPVVSFRYGAADGGADERQASLALGASSDRFRSSILVDAFERDFLFGRERDRLANQDYRRYGGTDWRSALAHPANIRSRTPANLPGLPSRVAAVPEGSTGVGLTTSDFLATAGQTRMISAGAYESIVPETERLGLSGVAEFDITETISVFAELLASRRETTTISSPPIISGAVVPATNPYNPFGVDVAVDYRFLGLPSRSTPTEAEALRMATGLTGKLGAWDWEVSALGIREDGSSQTKGNVDAARAAAALAATDPAQILNVFQDGPGGSPELLASLVAAPTITRNESRALQGGGFIRGDIATSWAPIGAVIGAEWRAEEIDFRTGTTQFPTERESAAAFAEFRVPLVPSGGVRGVEELALTLAGRLDHYDDFGDTVNPQYSIDYSPVRPVSIRATYSTSFRAPSLFELYRPVTSIQGVINDPARNERAAFTLVSGGNPDLEAEEAESWTVGFAIKPSANFRLRGAYWRIEQDQRVQQISVPVLLANESDFSSRIQRAAPTPADIAAGLPGALVSIDGTNVNFGSVKASGVDFEVSGSLQTSWGVFTPSFSTTWFDSYEAADLPGAPAYERVGLAHINGSIPDWRGIATISWTHGGVGLSTSMRYVPSYDDATGANVRTGRKIPSQALFDLSGSLSLDRLLRSSSPAISGVTIRGGISNLLDEEPHFAEVGSASGADLSQSDSRQRFGYVSISKSF